MQTCVWRIFLSYSMGKPSPALQGGTKDSVGDPATFGCLTISDRASKGIYEDESGPAILNFFHEAVRSECDPTHLALQDI